MTHLRVGAEARRREHHRRVDVPLVEQLESTPSVGVLRRGAVDEFRHVRLPALTGAEARLELTGRNGDGSWIALAGEGSIADPPFESTVVVLDDPERTIVEPAIEMTREAVERFVVVLIHIDDADVLAGHRTSPVAVLTSSRRRCNGSRM